MFPWLKTLFEQPPPKPPAEYRHDRFGVLLGEEGLWHGKVQQDGREIPFVVAGTEDAPDPRLLDRLLELLPRLDELVDGALRLLVPPDPPVPVRPSDFTFQSIVLLWPKPPDAFYLTFELRGDEGSIWRVEFHDGNPTYTGRDS